MNVPRLTLVLFAMLGLCSLAGAQTTPALPPSPAVPDQATLDKQFEATLSGAVLEGAFTVTGREGGAPKTEKYTIEKVTKLQGDYWLFVSRIQYGDRDVKIPLPLEVKWAGDTPVITLTDLNIPGLGTYTARVVIYRDTYAGMWSASDHGGHLFGRIVKATAADTEKSDKPAGEKKQ
jgi:hypothetical protein